MLAGSNGHGVVFGDPLMLPMLGEKWISVVFRVGLARVSRLVLAPECSALSLCDCLEP